MNLSRKSKLSIIAVFVLAGGLFAGVYVAQQNQETRSRADFNGDLTGNGRIINDDVTGSVIGDRNNINGDVGGSVYGNDNNIADEVELDVIGNDNIIAGDIGGCLKGDNNIVHGSVGGSVVGTRNIITGSKGSGPCPTTSSSPTPTVRPSQTVSPTSGPTVTPTTALGRCNDNIDNDQNGFKDGADSTCHTDGNPNNPNSYDRNRNGERSGGGTCADSIDNNNNNLTDGADPLCHTDSNPNNPGSYDPKRNETGSSPTVSPTLTPTPTVSPTLAISPTPTTSVSGTKLSFDLLLHGIGKGGDNANPNGTGNSNPLHPQRDFEVIVANSQNQTVQTKQGTISFDTSSGSFKGTVTLDDSVQTGAYTVKVKTDQFLRTLIAGIQTVTKNQTTPMPVTALINGEINGDNAINILDYNILIGCYSDLLPAPSCTPANKLLADLDDDGNVNQFDYNLFLRELTNRAGQ